MIPPFYVRIFADKHADCRMQATQRAVRKFVHMVIVYDAVNKFYINSRYGSTPII